MLSPYIWTTPGRQTVDLVELGDFMRFYIASHLHPAGKRAYPYIIPSEPSIYLGHYLYPSIHPSIHPFIHPSVHPSFSLSITLSLYLSRSLSLYLSIYLPMSPCLLIYSSRSLDLFLPFSLYLISVSPSSFLSMAGEVQQTLE